MHCEKGKTSVQPVAYTLMWASERLENRTQHWLPDVAGKKVGARENVSLQNMWQHNFRLFLPFLSILTPKSLLLCGGRLCIYINKVFFIIILQICTNFIISWENSTVSHRNTTLECVLRDGWKLCRCINDEILFFRFRVQPETSRNHLSIEASPTDNADET